MTDLDLYYGRQRRPDRLYFSRTFPLRSSRPRVRGQPARFVTKVFDEADDEPVEIIADEEIDTMEISQMIDASRRRKQLKLLVARAAGEVQNSSCRRSLSTQARTQYAGC